MNHNKSNQIPIYSNQSNHHLFLFSVPPSYGVVRPDRPVVVLYLCSVFLGLTVDSFFVTSLLRFLADVSFGRPRRLLILHSLLFPTYSISIPQPFAVFFSIPLNYSQASTRPLDPFRWGGRAARINFPPAEQFPPWTPLFLPPFYLAGGGTARRIDSA